MFIIISALHHIILQSVYVFMSEHILLIKTFQVKSPIVGKEVSPEIISQTAGEKTLSHRSSRISTGQHYYRPEWLHMR